MWGLLIYLLVQFSGLKRACKELREGFGVHKTDYEGVVAGIYRDMDDKDNTLKKDLEDFKRDHDEAVNAVYQEIETKVQTFVTQQEKARSDLDRRIDDAGSYTDRRFDQLLNKIEKEYERHYPKGIGVEKGYETRHPVSITPEN